MSKNVLVSIMVILCMMLGGTSVSFAKNVTYEFDFEGGAENCDFLTYFERYQEPEYVTQSGNTYMRKTGWVWSKEVYGNYSLGLDFMTQDEFNNGPFKGYVGIRVSENAGMCSGGLDNLFVRGTQDVDRYSAYVGTSGIYFYAYNDILEVGVHTIKPGGISGPVNTSIPANAYGLDGKIYNTKIEGVNDLSNRDFGVYSVTYLFECPGVNFFTGFQRLEIDNTAELISVKVGGTLICTIELSNLRDIQVAFHEEPGQTLGVVPGATYFDGPSYTDVSVKDASGKEVLKVEDAVVPEEGLICFGSGMGVYWIAIDNLVISEMNDLSTPTPTSSEVPSETERTTPSVTDTPTSKPKNDNGGESPTNWLLIIVISIVVVVATVASIIVYLKIKRSKGQ
jgi:hypothetical protein